MPEESRANNVRPYNFFGRAFSLGEDAIHAANTHKNQNHPLNGWFEKAL